MEDNIEILKKCLRKDSFIEELDKLFDMQYIQYVKNNFRKI